MKTLVIAATLFAAGVGAASAQPHPRWSRDHHPYAERHHSVCQVKAERLHMFERRAAADGRLSFWERRELRSLQRDLDYTCGRYRWHG